jgi:hypothetical protein
MLEESLSEAEVDGVEKVKQAMRIFLTFCPTSKSVGHASRLSVPELVRSGEVVDDAVERVVERLDGEVIEEVVEEAAEEALERTLD